MMVLLLTSARRSTLLSTNLLWGILLSILMELLLLPLGRSKLILLGIIILSAMIIILFTVDSLVIRIIFIKISNIIISMILHSQGSVLSVRRQICMASAFFGDRIHPRAILLRFKVLIVFFIVTILEIISFRLR